MALVPPPSSLLFGLSVPTIVKINHQKINFRYREKHQITQKERKRSLNCTSGADHPIVMKQLRFLYLLLQAYLCINNTVQ